MSLSIIPPELLLNIADNLPTASLSRLLRTCQSLLVLLSPTLTKRITTEHLATSILKSGIAHNHLPTVRLALAHNAPCHTKPNRKPCFNALNAACDRNQLATVAVLLTHYGAATITQLRCHANPFVTALKTDNVALLTVLLEHGAPPDFVNGDYQSALDIAAIYGYAGITAVLIEHGAAVHDAYNCLSYAMYYGNWDVVRVLLRAGVSEREWCSDAWARALPVGSRSPERIEAWIQGKMRDIEMCRAAAEGTGITRDRDLMNSMGRWMSAFM